MEAVRSNSDIFQSRRIASTKLRARGALRSEVVGWILLALELKVRGEPKWSGRGSHSQLASLSLGSFLPYPVPSLHAKRLELATTATTLVDRMWLDPGRLEEEGSPSLLLIGGTFASATGCLAFGVLDQWWRVIMSWNWPGPCRGDS